MDEIGSTAMGVLTKIGGYLLSIKICTKIEKLVKLKPLVSRQNARVGL